MNRILRPLLSAVLMLVAIATFRANGQMLSPDQTAITNLSVQKCSVTEFAQYFLFLPKDYDSHATKRWPVVLFLHGLGERGSNIWQTTVHGPVQYIAKHPDFPFVLVAPQCPGEEWSAEVVLGVLDQVEARYAVDTNRVYLTGLSMGGYGVWDLATSHAERFAAVAPISGGGEMLGVIVSGKLPDKTQSLKDLPFWVFHGRKDEVVPLSESERMVAAVKQFGCNEVKLTVYPEAKHNAWTQTYENPELYQWFLKHKRGSN
jgi:predicted peptidase